MHDISVLHHIILALDTHLAGGAHGGLGTIRHKIVVLYDLGPDEALFKVGMYDSGGLGALSPA